MMRGLALAGIAGLMLGGIIHIAIVFFIPAFAAADAWARISAVAPENAFRLLPAASPGNTAFADLDPAMAHAACRFSLEDGAVRINADIPSDFWSVAIFDRRGRNIYSLNDRSTEGRDIDLIIITPVQMALIRQDPPSDLDNAIIVERRIDEGFVLFRALVADPTLRPSVETALQTATCAPDL